MEFIINKLKNQDFSNDVFIIAVDGLGGAGKTRFVNRLKDELNKENYDYTILHIDDFIHQKCNRYNVDEPEWHCYYYLQWRYEYLIKELLEPIKCGEVIDKYIEVYSKENDNYFIEEISIPQGSILIIEGVFLQREELKKYFDFTVYLDASKDIRLNRVIQRDTYIGSEEEIIKKYETRYFPAEDKYISEYLPIENADYVLRDR